MVLRTFPSSDWPPVLPSEYLALDRSDQSPSADPVNVFLTSITLQSRSLCSDFPTLQLFLRTLLTINDVQTGRGTEHCTNTPSHPMDPSDWKSFHPR